MSAIDKQQFYNGQKVYKDDVNGLLDYTVKNLENLVITHLGYGIVTGFALTNEGGFALGVGAGLAYANDGKRLVLEAGKQVDLTTLAPTVGTKTILVGMLQDFIPSEPTTDNEGNLVYTKLTETVKFVSGVSLDSVVLPLASVELSSSGILIITSIAPTMEVAKSTSERTKGFENSSDDLLLKGKSLVFSRPDGFEHDLINGAWRKPTFDATKTEGYGKGDIIWLLPPDYGTLWTPPSTEVTYPWVMPAEHPYNLLGKAKPYNAQTSFKLYAIRLRSTKDNNTDNPLMDKSCIGSSWVVDEPRALCEEGSCTVNGVLVNITLYTGSVMEHYAKQLPLAFTVTGKSQTTFVYPIPFKTLINLEAWRGVNNIGANDWERSTVFIVNNQTSLTQCIVKSSDTFNSNGYMTMVSIRATGTWYQGE